MKKLILLIFVLFFATNVKAQMWCPPGAEWYFTAYSYYPSANGYFKSIYVNDTTVNSNVYKKINAYFYGYGIMWGSGFQIKYINTYFTHENNNVVYLNNDTLFNFNANIGDKWLRMQIKNNFIPNTFCDAPRRAVEVIDTGHIIINAMYLKRLTLKYQLKYVETNTLMPLTTYTDVVYQRIGSIGNNFSPEVCEFMSTNAVFEPISSTGFRCYSDNNFALYSNPQYTGTCTYVATTSLSELINENEFKLYPNPFTHQLTLNSSTNGLKKLIITNLLGQTVYKTEFYQNDLTLDLQQLHSGAYVAELYLNNKFNCRTKLIKQH
jgi:hypothetical protein